VLSLSHKEWLKAIDLMQGSMRYTVNFIITAFSEITGHSPEELNDILSQPKFLTEKHAPFSNHLHMSVLLNDVEKMVAPIHSSILEIRYSIHL